MTRGRKERILLGIEKFSRERWGIVLGVSLVLFLVCTWIGTRVRLESDVLSLIPRGNRQVDTFREALHEFGSIDYLIVLLEAGKDEGPDEIEDFADLLAEKLREKTDLVESVEYRFQPDARFLELFTENALLFLPPDKLRDVEAKLSDDAVRRQVRENKV
ncbi:MAG TPA: hypothetical protein VJ826_13050, partial [Candidatus Polarisedimenticolaceae bacterium]|nr:hypothetical protein [Candidatus Polarisedimenticolaceae bacterium]